MGLKIRVENFENVKEASVHVEGLTAFVGESNNGKTALYNAVSTLAKDISGQGYIRVENGKQVKEGCGVHVLVDGDKTVSFRKVKSSAEYTVYLPGVEPEVFGKATKLPELVEELLNVSPLDVDGTKVELNFMDQLQPPLLKTLTEPLLYRLAVKSHDGEKIGAAIKNCDVDVQEKKAGINTKSILVKERKQDLLAQRSRLEKYTPMAQLRDRFAAYSQEVVALPDVERLHEDFVEHMRQCLKMGSVSQMLEPASVVLDSYPTVSDMAELCDEYVLLHSQVEESVETLRILTSREAIFGTSDGLRALVSEMEQSALNAEQYALCEEQLQDLRTQIPVVEQKLRGLEFLDTYSLDGYYAESTLLESALYWMDSVNELSPKEEGLKAALGCFAQADDLLVGRDATVLQERILGELEGLSMQAGQVRVHIESLNEQLALVEESYKETKNIIDNKLCPQCGGKMEECDMALSQELKDKFEKVKAKRAELTAQKALLDQQQAKLYADIRAKGIEPEQLPAKVKELQESVASFEADAGPKLDKVLADLAGAENAALAGDVKQGDFAGHMQEPAAQAGTGLPPEVNFG